MDARTIFHYSALVQKWQSWERGLCLARATPRHRDRAIPRQTCSGKPISSGRAVRSFAALPGFGTDSIPGSSSTSSMRFGILSAPVGLLLGRHSQANLVSPSKKNDGDAVCADASWAMPMKPTPTRTRIQLRLFHQFIGSPLYDPVKCSR